jgi:3-phosphoshikimate 1-carboxyvinyltransferase
MAAGLRRLGVSIAETSDGAVIEGGALRGGEVESLGDHRIAMSFAIAGAIADTPIRISGCEAVATSFPGFVDLANGAGLAIVAVA